MIQHAGDGTYFHRKNKSLSNSRRWVTLTDISGKIHIDYGAYKALVDDGKSLLIAGITAYEGHFEKGEVVEVVFDNHCVGRGEIGFSSDMLANYIGKNKEQLKLIKPVVIHRDTWVKM